MYFIEKENGSPLGPDFYGHPSCNLSAGNVRETCTVLAGTKTSHSGLTSPDTALGHNGNYICVYIGSVCNIIYFKKRIQCTLRPVVYLLTPAGGSQSHDQYPRRARR